MDFIFEQILFFISIILVLFVPGYFLFLAVWGRHKVFSRLEKCALALGLSVVSMNFLIIFIGRIGIKINALSIIFLIVIFSAACYAIYRKYASQLTPASNSTGDPEPVNFSKNQTILIILILFLTVFIKTIYLSNTIFPTSTDMGHHMYWAKIVSETGHLPTYAEKDIVQVGENYQISEPQPIADFIIGEHLIFSVISLLSGASFISYFPSLILFLFNIFGILAIFILTLRLFHNYAQGKNIAIFTLFLIGPLYAISSSQAKFVSGGVIGNTIGNLLIPLALYLYLRALQEKSPLFLASAIFSTAGIFYCHHLTGFIFLYILAFSAFIFFIFNVKNIKAHFSDWKKILLSPYILCVLAGCLLFAIFVYTPSYLRTSAVGTAIGGPSKATRAGLTFSQLTFTSGETRMALGLIGLFLLFLRQTRKTFASAILGGWAMALLMMSLKPQWLYLDIPSGRIANYASFPLAILGAFAFVWAFAQTRDNKSGKFHLSSKIVFSLFIFFVSFAAVSGSYDNSQSLSLKNNFSEAVQTFHASEYLATKTNPQDDVILKDHNYITADAWMKLFYMRGYNYPFSRGFFKRYEDETKKREMCTLWMISTPNSADGQKCFSGTGTNFILVNPDFDGPQFESSKSFWKPYAGSEISIYYKNHD